MKTVANTNTQVKTNKSGQSFRWTSNGIFDLNGERKDPGQAFQHRPVDDAGVHDFGYCAPVSPWLN